MIDYKGGFIGAEIEARITLLREAQAEAQRFINAASQAIEHLVVEPEYAYMRSNKRSACRRASLDLSATLSEMRRKL